MKRPAMKMTTIRGLVLLAWLAAPIWAVAQDGVPREPAADLAAPGVLRVALEPREVTIGGRVEATLTLVWMGEEPADPPRFPSFGDGWGEAEMLEASGVEFYEDAGRLIYRQTLELAAFRVGPVELPAPTIAVPLAERTVNVTAEAGDSSLTFEVVSVLPEPAGDAEADPVGGDAATGEAPTKPAADPLAPRPPAPVVELPGSSHFAWTLLALATLLGLGLWRLAVALRDAEDPAVDGLSAVDPLSRLPPLDELRQRLAALEPSSAGPAHTGLSRALRIFLARRLGIPAVESTTTEIQRRLQRGAPAGLEANRLEHAIVRRTVDLLRASDRVKFARHPAPTAETARRLEETETLAVDLDRAVRAAEAERAETSVQGRPEAEAA